MPDGTPPPPPRTRRRPIRDAAGLVEAGLLEPGLEAEVAALSRRYAISLTPAVQALIASPDDPVGLQYVPSPDEAVTQPWEEADPTADAAHSPVKGVVHRYPDRALLKPLLACPVYCRFCFRREAVGPDGGLLTEVELEAALQWFARTDAVREAILTGGDPLMLSPRRLGMILGRLAALPHIEIIRLHSRVPVADPGRVTAALVAALGQDKPVYLGVHANHEREFSPAAAEALARLAQAGIPLLGQSVLLRGVNSSAGALEALFRAMLRHRVKPYYLHQQDRAPGTARFEVPEAEGLALMAALRGRVSGLAQPTYVRETPGGGGKVPVR
jgi:lysine 2,3-aminomutase